MNAIDRVIRGETGLIVGIAKQQSDAATGMTGNTVHVDAGDHIMG